MLWLGLALVGPLAVAGVKSQAELEQDARDKLDSVDAFFVKNVHGSDDLAATNQEEMTERLDKTVEFLQKMQHDRTALRAITDIELTNILRYVDGWLDRARTYRLYHDRTALRAITDIELTNIIRYFDGWLDRARTYCLYLNDRSKDFNQLKTEYNAFVRSAWGNGLDKLVRFVQTTTSAASLTTSLPPLLLLLVTTLLPTFLPLLRL